MASPGYFPQVDALRAIAMAGVVLVHTWSDDPQSSKVRVALFLVVSGFLMTRLLLRGRGGDKLIAIRNFYLRRELRLLPALFLLLGIVYALDLVDARSSILWHIFQLTNVYFTIYNTWEPWVLDHLWTLSLLEQFCLVWAPLVLLLSRRWLLASLISLVAIGIAFRAVDASYEGGFLLPFAWSDTVAAGALVAVFWDDVLPPRWLSSLYSLAVALALLFLPYAFDGFDYRLYHVLMTIGCTMILLGALRGYSGFLGVVLGSRILGYVGKISYGVFMYHLLVWEVLTIFGLPPELGLSTFAIVMSVSLIVASLSYHFYEMPIASLKRLVPVKVLHRPESASTDTVTLTTLMPTTTPLLASGAKAGSEPESSRIRPWTARF